LAKKTFTSDRVQTDTQSIEFLEQDDLHKFLVEVSWSCTCRRH